MEHCGCGIGWLEDGSRNWSRVPGLIARKERAGEEADGGERIESRLG